MAVGWTYGVRDAKAWPISADDGTAFTVGTPIDIGGIQSVEYAPEDGDTAELNGDDRWRQIRVPSGQTPSLSAKLWKFLPKTSNG